MRSHLTILNLRAPAQWSVMRSSTMKASDMRIYLTLAALAHVQPFAFVSGAPLTAKPTSSVVIADTSSQRGWHQSLALIISSFNGSSNASSQSSTIGPPSNSSTATLIAPTGLIPFRVKGSSTTLLFHSFGVTIPPSYMLQCLSISLTLVLEFTLRGRGRELIENGYFVTTHLLPHAGKVTIVVADFRGTGRPMDYFDLGDTLRGIGDFITEPGHGVTTLSFQIDVDQKGYVGTGHVDYEPFESSAWVLRFATWGATIRAIL